MNGRIAGLLVFASAVFAGTADAQVMNLVATVRAPANPPGGSPAVFVASIWQYSPTVFINGQPSQFVWIPVGVATKYPLRYDPATGIWSGTYQVRYPDYYQARILYGR